MPPSPVLFQVGSQLEYFQPGHLISQKKQEPKNPYLPFPLQTIFASCQAPSQTSKQVSAKLSRQRRTRYCFGSTTQERRLIHLHCFPKSSLLPNLSTCPFQRVNTPPFPSHVHACARGNLVPDDHLLVETLASQAFGLRLYIPAPLPL